MRAAANVYKSRYDMDAKPKWRILAQAAGE